MHGLSLVNFPLLSWIPILPLIGAAYTGFAGSRLSKRYGEPVIYWPAVLLPWASCVLTLIAVLTLGGLGHGTILHHKLWTWMAAGWLQVDLAFQMDRLSAVMALVVTFVGSLIHVYSIGYMKGDPSFWRFFSHLNLFMFAMLVLVLGDNLLVMFIGWEGVGLCSYLLIGFWYRDAKNAAAGMKAFIVNRVGDFGFSLGVFLLFWGLAGAPALGGGATASQAAGTAPAAARESAAAGHDEESAHGLTPGAPHGAPPGAGETAGSPGSAMPGHGETAGSSGEAAASHGAPGAPQGSGTHGEAAAGAGYAPTPRTSVAFREVEAILGDPARREGILGQKVLGMGLITLVCLLLFVGATGKSAQIPLYTWLPDAMAGPTPVSALIHAATMVTAGVYMVARLHFLFAASPTAMTVVATVGALTGLFAATIGLFQYDIKKVLAYSTVSQLGFMFLAAGVGAYWVAIFHLMTHAFFKACLFLGSGSVILGCHHEQDMRNMGGLRRLMPITAVTYFLAACAIAGFPFFSGFFSKDEILWKAFDSGNMLLPGGGTILWALAAAAALCTSFYMFRSYFMTFTGRYRGGAVHGHGHGAAAHATHSAQAGHDPRAAHDGGHGAHDQGGAEAHEPQESPRTMTWVLVILGALAVVGGYVGLPILWGLPNVFERWLEPVFAGSSGLVRSAHRGHGLEWGLMLFSVVVALAGYFLARRLYRDQFGPKTIPARIQASPNRLVRGVYRTVFNKYYVDEAYQASFVRGAVGLSTLLARFDQAVVDGLVNAAGAVGRIFGTIQGWIDNHLVDGAVNAVGGASVRAGRSVRKIQTGRIQSYVFGLTAGAVVLVVLGYMLVR